MLLIACSFVLALSCGDSGSKSTSGDVSDAVADASRGLETRAEAGADGPETRVADPTPWSEEATIVVDDLEFIRVDGQPFFALGFHASSGTLYDGVTGPGECDKETGVGYLDLNMDKTHAAAEAGANMVYLWGYGEDTLELLDVEPRFKGRFHDGYGEALPVEDDVVPVFHNAFGEVELDGYDEAKVLEMEEQFDQFINRTGKYSLESMPNLPPVEQVGHMAWHPTFRMIGTGDGSGEMLTPAQATALAQATNFMIGDTYTYVENRFDWNDPTEAIMAAATGQLGDKGEGYDDWLEADDPEHRGYFSSGFDLTYSLATKRHPGTVVWMWIQGYAFGDSIAKSECENKPDDSWATGDFPHPEYLRKEIAGMIAAGATGIVFFGFPKIVWDDTEIVLDIFRALSHPDVYEPALLSPRLELGLDTMFMGAEGYDGLGRAHLIVKWHEPSRTAYVIGANPGARETGVEIPFPWSLSKAELLHWDETGFGASDRLQIEDKTLAFTFKKDEGVIMRVTPVFGSSEGEPR